MGNRNLLRKFLAVKNKIFTKLSAKVLKKEDGVFLKIASSIPVEIINDLSTLFEKKKGITAAYLAEGFLEIGEKPHYIIGMDLDERIDGDIVSIMQSLAKDLQKIIPEDLYVDFIELNDQKTEINDFMKNYIIPFYTKNNEKV